MVIKECDVAVLTAASNFAELAKEYADECANKDLPEPSAKLDTYAFLQSQGGLHLWCAFLGEELIGYISVIVPVMPHYSAVVAFSESFFVAKKHRKTGAGLKLLRTAEEHAKQAGSQGLLVSAPFGGDLAEVLPNVGYREANRVFFKGLTHGK